MPEALCVNGAEVSVLRLLGKGKGGYSYLVTDGSAAFVLKQLYHEPCDDYTFSDKLQSELRGYQTLRKIGIPMPALFADDRENERILKEYLPGPTVQELLLKGQFDGNWLFQVRAMCTKLYPAGLNIDYYPTNFVIVDRKFIMSTMSAIPSTKHGTSSTGRSPSGRRSFLNRREKPPQNAAALCVIRLSPKTAARQKTGRTQPERTTKSPKKCFVSAFPP